MKNIAILTSGGDAPGMNAAIRAVTRCSIYNGMNVYGIERGFEGLMDGDFIRLDVSSVADILQRGGTMLKTARSERFRTEEGITKACEMLETFEIDTLVVIGGNGSLRGGLDLSRKGIRVIGIPATIDNDLAYTDFTIGFDTSVNTILSAVSNIRDTSLSHERTTVIEVMGRDCGDIALYAGLAGGAEFILIPEEKPDLNAMCRKILQGKNRGKKQSIIINAEGSGIASGELADFIMERTGLDTKVVVPGYIQRGGSPTAGDRILASELGHMAVDLIMKGESAKAVGVRSGRIISDDLSEAVNLKKKYNGSMMKIADMLSI